VGGSILEGDWLRVEIFGCIRWDMGHPPSTGCDSINHCKTFYWSNVMGSIFFGFIFAKEGPQLMVSPNASMPLRLLT